MYQPLAVQLGRDVASAASVRELWAELSAGMRLLRTGAGFSLRQVEAATGRGRGVLSQIENCKTRPNRAIVEWYDEMFGGNGVLLSTFAEARAAYGPTNTASLTAEPYQAPGDSLRVESPLLAFGQLVGAGAELTAGWSLHNSGTTYWHGRRLHRVGAPAAARLIASAVAEPIPECLPQLRAGVRVPIRMPERPGTYVAYWQVVDELGRTCFPDQLLSVALVVAN